MKFYKVQREEFRRRDEKCALGRERERDKDKRGLARKFGEMTRYARVHRSPGAIVEEREGGREEEIRVRRQRNSLEWSVTSVKVLCQCGPRLTCGTLSPRMCELRLCVRETLYSKRMQVHRYAASAYRWLLRFSPLPSNEIEIRIGIGTRAGSLVLEEIPRLFELCECPWYYWKDGGFENWRINWLICSTSRIKYRGKLIFIGR